MVAKAVTKENDMSAAREEMLARIRLAKLPGSSSRAEDYAGIRHHYRRTGQLDIQQRLALFEERLRDYGATVYRCTEDRIAEVVAQAMAARGAKNLLFPTGVPTEWLPKEYEFRSGDAQSYRELDASEGTLTGCTAAIAMTGTIILEHRPGQGQRAVTLIPDYHLCVVFSRQIFETVPEGMQQFASSSRFPITTISGPSATADIEMTRVKGVHGPRFFDVILVEE